MSAVKKGGVWVEPEGKKAAGATAGLGLYHHYKQMMTLLWPDDDWHRWAELALHAIIENEITVFCGSGDSNKTYSVARFVLCDWWAHVDNTLWMVSSTELRGAELRVWGTLKQLYNRARERHDWLEGTVLESKHAIVSEEISEDGSEARLLTKGIIFIPCKSGNTYVGLGCFPEGQIVSTPSGPVPIQDIKEGDRIIGAFDAPKVGRHSVRIAPVLVRVTLSDGRQIDCTPEHLFLTEWGWIKSIDIPPGTHLMCPYDSLQDLREADKKTVRPCQILFREVQNRTMEEAVQGMPNIVRAFGGPRAILHPYVREQVEVEAAVNAQEIHGEQRQCGDGEKSERNHPLKQGRVPSPKGKNDQIGPKTGGGESPLEKARVVGLRVEPRSDSSRIDSYGVISRSSAQPRSPDWQIIETGECPTLHPRFGLAANQAGRGGRRVIPPTGQSDSERPETGRFSSGSRVDSVTILKPDGDSRYDKCTGGYRVHNLEVDGHPSYCVNGVIVHNSYAGVKPTKDGRLGHAGDEVSFMQRSFLDAYSNWYGKEHFKGLLTGNPTDLDDPLCTAAEPLEGWENWVDTGKTQEWKSKFYGAHVVAFDGRDSPNFDFPGPKPKFSYMIGPKKIEAVKATEGEDSPLFWMQCIGKPRPGAEALKVITQKICQQNRAFEDVIWQGTTITQIAALDAAYGGVGGDRCVLKRIEFGKDIEGKWVIRVHPKVLVPVVQRGVDPADRQIARFCKSYCEGFGINPQNFFFDGRSTLAVAIAQAWSANVNVVDFGGVPTKRPVSLDHFVRDESTGLRRLKRCDEHYSKFVTELWFSVYYVIVSGQMRNLPKEDAEEGCKRIWRMTKGNRIEVETKAEMKVRTNQSPDIFDSLVTAVEGARRLGFQISKLANQGNDGFGRQWFDDLVSKHKGSIRRRELNYTV